MLSPMTLFVLSALVAQPPAAQSDVPFLPEDIAPSLEVPAETPPAENPYILLPGEVEVDPLFAVEDLAQAGTLTLSAQMRGTEEALNGCSNMRKGMEAAILNAAADEGAVHPEWFNAYSRCIRHRNAELKALGKVLRTRQQSLLEVTEGEDALNAADSMARLSTYHTKLRRAVREEVTAQSALVNLYNEKNR